MGVEDGWVGVGIEGFAGDGVTTCSLYTLYIYTHNFNIGVITCYTKIILIYNISL